MTNSVLFANFCMGDAFAALTKLQWTGNHLKLFNSVPATEVFFPELKWGLKKKKEKVFAENWSVFSWNQVKTKYKKKRSSPQYQNLGLYSAGICRIYLCWMALDRFIIQRSNFDGWTSKSWWGDAKSQWGYANSRWGDATPLQFKYWTNWKSYREQAYQKPTSRYYVNLSLNERNSVYYDVDRMKNFLITITVAFFLLHKKKEWQKSNSSTTC